MIFKLSTLLYLTLQCNTVFGVQLSDPTRPDFYSVREAEAVNQKQLDDLRLSAIWSSAHDSRVTINGVTAKQGELIFGDIIIIKIHDNSVLISQNGRTRTLYLLAQPIKIHRK